MTVLDEPTASFCPPACGPLQDGNRSILSRFWPKKLWVVVVLIYLTAFALPVFDDTGILANHLGVRPKGSVYGWQAFLVGFFVQRTGWFANVAIWIGAFLMARRKPLVAAAAGVVALGLGAMYLSLLVDHSLLSPRSFSVGYFCWLGSAVLLAGPGVGLWWLGSGRSSLIFATATTATGVGLLVMVTHLVIAMTAPPSEATLAGRLISGDINARRAAARKLALEHNPELIPVFIQATSDPDDKVRQSAISALGDIGPPAATAVPTLIAILNTPLPEAQIGTADRKRAANSRSAAAAALGNIGPAAKAAVAALAAALKDENLPVRRWSATSLGEMGSDSRSAIPSLLRALDDSDVQVRRYAIVSLKKIGLSQDALPALATSLHDADSTVRETAAELLNSVPKSP